MVYFNNYLYDLKRPQLPEHPSTRHGATPTGSHPSGLPLPTPPAPMAAQPLMNRPPMWPSSRIDGLVHGNPSSICLVSGPGHGGPPGGHYYNHFHQARQPRPSFPYGGPMNRPP